LSLPQEGSTANESLSAHMCVNEISKQMRKSSVESLDDGKSGQEQETSFVTVIAVNGLNKKDPVVVKQPPK